MDRQARFVLLNGIMYSIANTIASGFVNVFLIRVTDSIGPIIIQNILSAATILSAFVLGEKLMERVNILHLLRLGIGLTASYYLIILLLQERTAYFIIPLGIFNGLGTGFYFFCQNILIGRMVPENERGKFFGLQQSFGSFFGIVTPIISGFIIVQFTELTGYYILFIASIVIFVLGVGMTTQLKGFTFSRQQNALKALMLKGNKYWSTDRVYNFTFGASTMIHGQIFILTAFYILNNEQLIGYHNALGALMGLFSSLWLAKKLNKYNRHQFHLTATLVFLTVLGALAFTMSPWALTLAFIGMGIVNGWNSAIYQTFKFELARLAQGEFSVDEFIVAAEFPMAAGRIIGLVVSLVVSSWLPLHLAYGVLLVVVALLVLFDHLLLRFSVNWLKAETAAADAVGN